MALVKERGFTLIELLIAVFIFALLAAIVMSGIYTVLNSRSVLQDKLQAFAQIQIAETIIARDLTQIINRPITNAIGRQEYAMDFQPRNPITFSFTRAGFANPGALATRSTLQRVAYLYRDNQLIRETWPVLDRVTDSNPSQRVLLDNIQSLNWKFYDDKNNVYTLWPPVNIWQGVLPNAIELTIEIKKFGKINRLVVLPG